MTVTNVFGLDTPGVVAGRIRFVQQPDPSDTIVAEFHDPTNCVAVRDALDIETLLLPELLGAEKHVGFVLVPAGAATPYGLRKRIEDWIAQPNPAESGDFIMITQLSDQILWRPNRFVIIGDPARIHEFLPALIAFAYHEGELRRMERETDEHLRSAEMDIGLTHQVSDADLARWPRANEGVRRATLLRIHFARLEPRLERPSLQLAGATRRFVSELVLQTDVVGRLEVLDDRIEVLQDLYESATDRLSEYSYFRREYRLEIGIIIVLLVEIAAIVWEIVVMSPGIGAPV